MHENEAKVIKEKKKKKRLKGRNRYVENTAKGPKSFGLQVKQPPINKIMR